MITVRTKRKIGMTQQQLGGTKEEAFLIGLAQNVLDFIDKYSDNHDYEDSLLYSKLSALVKEKDYAGIDKILSTLQIFGSYDKISQITIKYKNSTSAVGRTYNGTVFEGRPDEKKELERIVAHTCALCSSEGSEYLGKLLA